MDAMPSVPVAVKLHGRVLAAALTNTRKSTKRSGAAGCAALVLWIAKETGLGMEGHTGTGRPDPE